MHIAYVCTYPLICGQDGYVVAQWGLSPFEVSCIQRQFQKKDVTLVQNLVNCSSIKILMLLQKYFAPIVACKKVYV